jgi:hypothetical protein
MSRELVKRSGLSEMNVEHSLDWEYQTLEWALGSFDSDQTIETIAKRSPSVVGT